MSWLTIIGQRAYPVGTLSSRDEQKPGKRDDHTCDVTQQDGQHESYPPIPLLAHEGHHETNDRGDEQQRLDRKFRSIQRTRPFDFTVKMFKQPA